MDVSKHPWVKGGVRVPRATMESIEAHAREAYAAGVEKDGAHEGEEACGTIDGPAHDPLLADRATRVANLANKYHALAPDDYPRTGRTYFLIDPLKFARGLQASEAEGRPVKVLYHSHLDCGAYFSE